MIKICFLTSDNGEHIVDAEPGKSLMHIAVGDGISGIAAECGGAMSCATCHVHIHDEWFERLPEPEQGEQDMLEFADNICATSRLSCQVEVTPEMDGLIVCVPS